MRQSSVAYMEENSIWEQVQINGSFSIECGTPGRAIHMVQRLNQARIANRKRNYEQHRSRPLGDSNSVRRKTWELEVHLMEAMQSPWDIFTIKRPDSGSIIHIEKRERLFTKAWNAEGEEIHIPEVHLGRFFLKSHRMNEDGSYWMDENGNEIAFMKKHQPEHAGDIGLDSDQPLGLDIGGKK